MLYRERRGILTDERKHGFVWDAGKEAINIEKHGVDFVTATKAFKDPHLRIFVDANHSHQEERFFCFTKVKERVITVRFSYREGKIRIIGVGFWRKGAKYYDQKKYENN